MSIEGKNIKDYYEEIMQEWKNADGSYKGYRCEWYDRYNYIIEMVRKKKLEIDKRKLDADIDREFLKFLLLERDNGIADADTGQISDIQFKNFINEPNIIKAIEEVIKAPSAKANENLGNAVRQCNIDKGHRTFDNKNFIKNNWLIVNRVTAACTTDISSTVDRKRFFKVFDKLIESGMIADYPNKSIFPGLRVETQGKEMKEKEWYEENIYLMEELSKQFAEELDNGKMDPILLSVFVWEIWVDNFRNKHKASKS